MSSTLDRIVVPRPNHLSRNLIILGVVALIVGSAWFAGFDVGRILVNLRKGGRLLGRMFLQPDWAYAPRIMDPLLETVRMSVVGTFLGAVLAFPTAVFAANNFIRNPWIAQPLRVVLNITRSIPAMVMASVFVAVFGIGAFSGVAALVIFTLGLISKLTFESIEAIDYGQVEALLAVGADKPNVLRWAIVPQILPQFLSYTLYGFEINVRAAAVLGYVGAGGIGQIFEQNLAWRNFDRVGVIIIISFIVVLAIDLTSSALRKRLV
ncbi:MAG TPA: phosphonate ABC transporter, permease protein PhnE [Magnetospirillaceae bacterium]|nr:phosphonate ABC transporter, permease protein PhnE [Magnetospirillaceae bacterium]